MGSSDRRFRLRGAGWALPERRLGNDELGRDLGVDPESITARTGILERRIAADTDTASSLGLEAAQDALRRSGVDPAEIDLVLLSTYTPDCLLCPTSPVIAEKLGADHAGAFDLNAACSGGVTAIQTACSLLADGTCRKILVVSADLTSKFIAEDDPKTRLVFGDGAAALILESANEGKNDGAWRILSSCMGSDGHGADLFRVEAGGSASPSRDGGRSSAITTVSMNGRAVFRFGVEKGSEVIESLCEKAGLSPADVRWVIPHQANLRIITALQERIAIAPEKWYLNLEKYGNTASASVTLALAELVVSQRVDPGDVIVLAAFGAGLTWSGIAIQCG